MSTKKFSSNNGPKPTTFQLTLYNVTDVNAELTKKITRSLFIILADKEFRQDRGLNIILFNIKQVQINFTVERVFMA